jgi:hypothetical protein
MAAAIATAWRRVAASWLQNAPTAMNIPVAATAATARNRRAVTGKCAPQPPAGDDGDGRGHRPQHE